MKYEVFYDVCYYDQWAVRPVGEKRWGHCYHLPSKEEAEGLAKELEQLYVDNKEIGNQLDAAIKGCAAAREELQLAKVENNHNWQFQSIHEETLKENARLKDQIKDQAGRLLRQTIELVDMDEDQAKIADLEAKITRLRETIEILMVPFNESITRNNGGLPSGVYVQRFRFEQAQKELMKEGVI